MTVSWARVRDVGRKHLAGILAGVAVVGLVQFGLLETLEHWSLDRLFEWRGPRTPHLSVVIVTIDESSFAELNEQWPFPRAMHGQLLTKIAAGKPLAIGVDLIFDAPSSRGPADDRALGAAVSGAGRVVLGAAITDDIQPFYTRTTLNPPILVIREGAAGVAPVNLTQDPDGHIRRVPLWTPLDAERIPGLDVQIHRLLARAGVHVAPLPDARDVLINFRGGLRTYPWVSYYRVLRDEIPPEFWKDKIVLVGPTTEILHDQFATAFAGGGDMPGVEIHANALETLVRGDAIREVPVLVSAIATVVAGLIVGALVAWLPGRAVEGSAGVLPLLVVATYVAFAYGDVWFRATGPGLALAVGLVLSIVARGLPPAPSP